MHLGGLGRLDVDGLAKPGLAALAAQQHAALVGLGRLARLAGALALLAVLGLALGHLGQVHLGGLALGRLERGLGRQLDVLLGVGGLAGLGLALVARQAAAVLARLADVAGGVAGGVGVGRRRGLGHLHDGRRHDLLHGGGNDLLHLGLHAHAHILVALDLRRWGGGCARRAEGVGWLGCGRREGCVVVVHPGVALAATPAPAPPSRPAAHPSRTGW